MPVKRVKICRDPDDLYKDWHHDVGSDAVKGIGALEGEEPGRTYETDETEEQNILLVTVPWSDDNDVNGDEDLRDALRPKYLRAFGA